MADVIKEKRRISLKETFNNLIPEDLFFIQVGVAILVGLITLGKGIFLLKKSF